MKFDSPVRIFVCDKCNEEFHTLNSYYNHQTLYFCANEGKTVMQSIPSTAIILITDPFNFFKTIPTIFFDVIRGLGSTS